MFQTIKTFNAKKHTVKFIIFFSISIITSNTVAMFKSPQPSCLSAVQVKVRQQLEHIKKVHKEHQETLTRFIKHKEALEEIKRKIQIKEEDQETVETPQARSEQEKLQESGLQIQPNIELIEKFLILACQTILNYKNSLSLIAVTKVELTQIQETLANDRQAKQQSKVLWEKDKLIKTMTYEIIQNKLESIRKKIDLYITYVNWSVTAEKAIIQNIDALYANLQQIAENTVARNEE